MKRRDFIKQSAAAGAGLGIGLSTLGACTSQTTRKLTILHTNDVHSHIEAFDPDHSRFPNMGGVARRAALIQQIRKENPYTLLFDAGDIFQGTPYFNYYGGELEFKLMSSMGYDAATLGNHDFDNGVEGLNKQLPHARFDFVVSNYDLSNTALDGKTQRYKVYIRNGIRVGVFGLGIDLDGLVDPTLFKETRYLDPVGIAQDMTRILRKEKQCDLVIGLSHLGYNYPNSPGRVSDMEIAKNTDGISLIIGGHTHTFLKKPTVVKNRKGQNMLINQVGCWGVQLGRIDFEFNAKGVGSTSGTSIVV